MLIGLTACLAWISHSRGAVRRLTQLLALAILISLVTGASMVPTPSGFIWGKWALVIGDVALLFVLATAAAIWLRRLVYRSAVTTS